MSVHLIEQEDTCRLVFEGALTYEHARDLEDRIIHALRRHARFEVDLSGVSEIDLCGIHLLRILETVAGDNLEIVSEAPLIERTRERLLSTTRSTWLRSSRNVQDQDREFAEAA